MSQFISEDHVKTNITYREMLRRLWPYNKKHLGLLSLVFIFIAGLSISSRLLPTLIGYGIDNGILKNNRNVLIDVAIAYLVIQIIYTFCEFAYMYFFQVFGNRILYYIREDLLLHVERLPIQYFDKNPTGRIVTRLTNDIANLGELFSDSLINVLSQTFIIISILISMFLISPKLTAATLILTPPFLWANYQIGERIRIILRESKKRLSTMNSFIAENINGIKIIQLYNRANRNIQKFSKFSNRYSESLLQSIRVYASMQPVMNLFNAVTISIALYYGGFLSQNNSLAIGSLVAFLMHVQDFIPPLREILEKFQQLQNSLTSAERVFQIFDEVEEAATSALTSASVLTTSQQLTNQQLTKGKISIKNLTFRYEPHLPIVLDNISLEIKSGESIAIIGRTGSGKSTLISILQRFYETPKNSVFVNDIPIHDIPLDILRKHIGVVQQENFIFRGSLRDNISLGDPNIQDEKILHALEQIGCTVFLSETGHDLNFKIEERGSNLSVGERQLIAFARILVFQPEILILDEATANMDSATEEWIQNATKEITKDRTSIIIAHRLSTIKDCHKIVVMSDGKIVETGPYHHFASAGVNSILSLASAGGIASP